MQTLRKRLLTMNYQNAGAFRHLSKVFDLKVRAAAGLEVVTPCPECGALGPHDTNGDLRDPSASCAECSACFDLDLGDH